MMIASAGTVSATSALVVYLKLNCNARFSDLRNRPENAVSQPVGGEL